MKKTLLFLFFMVVAPLWSQDFWTPVTTFENAASTSSQISIVNDQVVWVLNSPTVTSLPKWNVSLDEGQTWTSGDINLGNLNIKAGSLSAVSATTAYVSAYNSSGSGGGGVWVTQNSGATWTQQTTALFSAATSFPNFIHFFDANNGIVLGDPDSTTFEIYTTSDAGVTWTRVPSANIPAPTIDEYAYNNKFEARGSSVWFGTSEGKMYISHDKGLTWAASQSPVNEFGSAIVSATYAFKNDNEGIMVTDGWYSYRTSDGGITWNTGAFPSEIPHNHGLAYVPNTNNAYYNWGTIIDFDTPNGHAYSVNGGVDWNQLSFEQPLLVTTAKFYSGTVGYCIARDLDEWWLPTSGWQFYRLTDPLNRLGNQSFTQRTAFTVSPNPANGIVKISGSAIHQISLCDISGKVVLTQLFTPQNQVSIDISGLQNGIYLAKISDNLDGSSVVKIVKN